MVLILTILIAFISVLLILIILVQNPKGGGLSSSFGGSKAANQVMGAANTGDMLEKITWGLASSLLALCLVTGVFFKSDGASGTVGEEIIAPTTTSVPSAPTGAPGGQPLTTPPNN
jgi:preprotein translocase subunit SecG